MSTTGMSREINRYSCAHRRKRKWLTAVTCLAAVVVFCTVYALILPAITLESGVYCGMTEHTHSEDCYASVLTCGQEAGEGHTHTEDCYTTENVLVCGQEESEGHSHSESCYDADGVVICGQTEQEGHAHTDACYEPQTVQICGQTEGEGHVHTEDCYGTELTCGLEEHSHSDACYSNPAADTETAADWEAMFADVELTGVWADDLLSIAESQIGYTESAANYAVTENGSHKGYTRYGAWYGMPYEDWCAMFVSFCLNYAGIPAEAMPRASACQAWIDTLSGPDYGLYVTAENAAPAPGDLVFFDFNGDGTSDHVGIVAEYSPATSLSAAVLKTIEGNSSDQVKYVTYDPAEASILGYAVLPQNPEQYIMLLSGDTSVIDISKNECIGVDAFYLWLNLNDSNYTKVYGNSEWDNETTGGSTGITDALSYMEEEQTYYLIPISYFTEHYKDYGYTFNESDPGECPFVYLPDATKAPATASLVDACYVKVVSEETEDAAWYVRVTDDTTSETIGRSNLYYTPSNSFTLTYGDYTVTFNVVAGDGTPIYGDYSKYNAIVEDGVTYEYDIPIPEITGYSHSCTMLEGNYAVSYVKTNDTNNIFRFYNSAGGFFSRNASVSVNLVYGKTVEGLSPSGTVINLFDYWVTGQKENDVTSSYPAEGINLNHALKFTPNKLGEYGVSANAWTKSTAVYPGIVNNVLTDGYPTLTTDSVFGINDSGDMVSGNYYPSAGDGLGESLAYLFDPSYTGDSAAHRSAYRNVTGLLQEDSAGYFYYDSTQNYAEYNEETNSFTLYSDWAVQYGSNEGQFFPFDPYGTVTQTTYANNTALNHYFGMTLTTRFIQQYGGHTDSVTGTPMVFEFSGDDDVWIFIDDVLVADLGGIHDAASVSIDFATGAVTINGETDTTIKAAFTAADEVGDESAWNGDTFADGTYHTLKFFYLERGSYASNLKLKYNLNSYPPTSIYKVNQYGDAVAGAVFAVYAADADYNILSGLNGDQVDLPAKVAYDEDGNIYQAGADGEPTGDRIASALYTGATDSSGKMVFVDDDGMPYTLSDLQRLFGTTFVLREIRAPDGYRLVSDTIKLRIYNDKVMLCDNTYDSGVYADASLLVTAPNTLKGVDDVEHIYYDGNGTTSGTLFAVVLKYVGPDAGHASDANLAKRENWAPVYGNDVDGFTIVDVTGKYSGNFTQAAIETVRQYTESQPVFAMSSGGQMQAAINGMPGDITKYYYMLGTDKSETQYTVAYYYSTADSLAQADSSNTVRINSDLTDVKYAFTRSFGATIQVPNLVNRLVVQKLDSEGELVNGASFALYSVVQETDGDRIYYKAEDGTLIYLYPDDGKTDGDETAGDNEGVAELKGGGSGKYTVGANGVITVTVNDKAYTITPVGVETTTDQRLYTSSTSVRENGSASFTNMDDGYYYLREIAAPKGYILNPTEVMVLVDETAVYANAGTEDDGVTVARGPGYVVSTLDMFASQGQIDNTLTWVYEQLLVSDVSTKFQEVYTALGADGNPAWKYLMANNSAQLTDNPANALTTYLVYNKGGENTLYNYTVNEGRYGGSSASGVTRRLYTSVGWSYYLLYQDYVYGSQKTQGTSVNYTDLSGQEISNLFSRSTFVQVTDQAETGSLEISKKVENGANTVNDTQFTFTVDLKDSAGNDLLRDFGYTVTEDDTTLESGTISYDSETKKWSVTVTNGDESKYVSITSGDITVYLTDGQKVTIDNIPYAAQYTVTETQNTRYTTTAVRDVGKAALSDAAGEESFSGNSVKGTLYWVVRDDTLINISTVDYTNTYLEDLAIWKVDAGDPNTTLPGAEFTLKNSTTDQYFDGKEWKTEEVTLTTDDNGHISLDIAALKGGTYILTETKPPDGYYALTDTITFTVSGDGKITDAWLTKEAQGSDASAAVVAISDDGLSLTVKNTSGYELPETGGAGAAGYTLGGIALMGAALSLRYQQRKKRSA